MGAVTKGQLFAMACGWLMFAITGETWPPLVCAAVLYTWLVSPVCRPQPREPRPRVEIDDRVPRPVGSHIVRGLADMGVPKPAGSSVAEITFQCQLCGQLECRSRLAAPRPCAKCGSCRMNRVRAAVSGEPF